MGETLVLGGARAPVRARIALRGVPFAIVVGPARAAMVRGPLGARFLVAGPAKTKLAARRSALWRR